MTTYSIRRTAATSLFSIRRSNLYFPQQLPPMTPELLRSLLDRCSTLREAKRIHAQILVNGFLDEKLTVGKLVAFCAVSKSGDLLYAREVFDNVPETNRFMWNSLIRGYSDNGFPQEVLTLQARMFMAGVLPNQFTLPFVLKACASMKAFWETVVLHASIIKLGLRCQVFVQNALIHAYGACGYVGFASQVFRQTPNPNLISWNSMINAYSQAGKCHEAARLFSAMKPLGLCPDRFTFVSLLCACSETRNSTLGKLMHHYIVTNGIITDTILENALLDMYAKCDDLETAELCFDRTPIKNLVTWTMMLCAYVRQGYISLAKQHFEQMPEMNLVSWNSIIACHVQCGFCHEALDIYKQMQALKVKPDEITLTSILSACSHVGNLALGKEIHDYVIKSNMKPGLSLFNSLIDMYAKCACIETAVDIFRKLSEKNVISWNVMIGGFALCGLGLDAIRLFDEMVGKGLCPDEITFTALLSACSHSGLLDDGCYYFNIMSQVYSIEPCIEHYACMVDLLGRKGRVHEALELIENMSIKPDIVIWSALLGACRIHGHVFIGNIVLKQLLELHPSTGGLYVLASNLYHEADRLEDTTKIRRVMKDIGVRKDKAVSLIEISGNIHEFLVDDKRYSSLIEIHSVLSQFNDHHKSINSTMEFCTVDNF